MSSAPERGRTVGAWAHELARAWLLACGLSGVRAAQQKPPPKEAAPARAVLVPAGAIELPKVEGRIDHLAIDLARERLFVAALGNDSVEVCDLKAGKVERKLPASEPQGILYLADLDRMVVTNGRSGALDVYAGDTLEHKASVTVGDDADNLRYDPRTKRVFVAYGEGALGIVDATTWKVSGKIELASHPEAFQLDAAGKLAFVNVPHAHQIVVVDLEAQRVKATWDTTTNNPEKPEQNFPMCWTPMSGTEGLVVVGCRALPRLVVLATPNGEMGGAIEVSGDADDLFHDDARRRVYAICGAGSVDVFVHEPLDNKDARWVTLQGSYPVVRPLAKVPTAAGARTGLFVPERDQLFVAVPHRGEQRAEVRIFGVRD